MAKPTAKINVELTFDTVVDALHSEMSARERGEKMGSKRRSSALQLVLAYPERARIFSTWCDRIVSEGDSRDEAYTEIAKAFKFENESGADKTNYRTRAVNTIQFATHMVRLKYAECVEFAPNGAAHVNGNTTLANDLWSGLGWTTKKNMEGRAVSQPIVIVQRSSDRRAGELSWSQLEDFVRGKAGLKQGGNRASPKSLQKRMETFAKEQPVKLIDTVKEAFKLAEPSHFKVTGGQAVSLDTIEDIFALVTDDDEKFAKARKMFDNAMSEARAVLGIKRSVEVQNEKVAA